VRKAIASLASALLCTLAMFSAQAKADTVVNFNISGTFADGATLSGTVTIDTTTGTATGMDVTASTSPTPITFNTDVSSVYAPGDGEVLIEGYDSTLSNELVLGVVGSSTVLQGYTGGTLAGTSSTPFSPASFFAPGGGEGTPVDLTTGALTAPGTTTTPAPATLTLAATAMLAFVGFRFCRRRPRASTT
jgi:hypothetical protein